MKKRPLSYYEKKGYVIDDAFFEEYANEIKFPKIGKKRKI